MPDGALIRAADGDDVRVEGEGDARDEAADIFEEDLEVDGVGGGFVRNVDEGADGAADNGGGEEGVEGVRFQ